MADKTAVVFFNLGGPDSPETVEPFLFNLFNDKAIIGAPGPIRYGLAKYISKKRAPIAREIYKHLGGKSPLLELTRAQERALESKLGDLRDVKVFSAMRYWNPLAPETVADVKAWGPDRIVLMPLYPHFSTATTGSSMLDWQEQSVKAGMTVPVHTVCCYPWEENFVAGHARLVREALDGMTGPVRILFSAHGLPKKIVAKGDPYQWQVERTAEAVAKAAELADGSWTVCYQSRVGPLEWIGPSTDDEVGRAGAESIALIVVPIAFVSEHSETLVELDIEYRELAVEKGVPEYVRVPALGTIPEYIESLAQMTRAALLRDGVCSHTGDRLCPESWGKCPMKNSRAA